MDRVTHPNLARYTWRLDAYGYASRCYKTAGRLVRVFMHREVLNAEPGVDVDHEDGNKLNNQLSNLRRATKSQNAANKGRRSDNTTGFKGVIREGSRFRAQTMYRQKRVYIGVFDTSEEAARAYDDKVVELFNQFAALNFPREGYRCIANT